MTSRVVFLRGLIAEATAGKYRIWSVERFIARRKCKPEVAARLRRLNPNGVEEGSLPRGYRQNNRGAFFIRDTLSPREFVSQYGRDAYDAVPNSAVFRQGHRKGIVREYVEDHF